MFRNTDAAGTASDNYRSVAAGLRFNLPISAQQVVGEAAGRDVRFGRFDELGIYVKGALRSGVTVAEIQEILIHAIAYCGTPAGRQAFLAAHRTLSQEGALG